MIGHHEPAIDVRLPSESTITQVEESVDDQKQKHTGATEVYGLAAILVFRFSCAESTSEQQEEPENYAFAKNHQRRIDPSNFHVLNSTIVEKMMHVQQQVDSCDERVRKRAHEIDV